MRKNEQKREKRGKGAPVFGLLVFAFIASFAAYSASVWTQDWRTASREPAGIAPDPAVVKEAVVQVYVARAFNWRGFFGVHSWIAVKPANAPQFTVYEAIGWNLRRGGTSLAIHNRPADARWFGATPKIIADIRGRGVDGVIQRIDAAARSYPLAGTYRVWPGPNSNTFTAYVARAAPELKLDLPPTAIGKDYIPGGVFAKPPGGEGFQVSLFGMLGLLVGSEEGVEVNLLGMVYGVDPLGPALKLPVVGRLGWGR